MSSNDKTADLLVATTRASKGETGTVASETEVAAAAEKPATKKAPVKKAATKKKAPAAKKTVAKKSPAKKAPAKKVSSKSQKETLVDAFTAGGRIWPD